MATVDKTWNFESDAEGLADQGNSASIIAAWQTGDSQSGSGGCLKFTCTTKNSNTTEYAYNSSTGTTWEGWGVPAGGTVTQVQITACYEKTVAVTKISSQSVSMRIIGSGGTTVHSAGDLYASYNPGTGTDSSWQSMGSGTARAVDAGSQASNTDVRLRIDQTIATSGSSAACSVDQRYDTITLTITYDPPAAPTNVVTCVMSNA